MLHFGATFFLRAASIDAVEKTSVFESGLSWAEI